MKTSTSDLTTPPSSVPRSLRNNLHRGASLDNLGRGALNVLGTTVGVVFGISPAHASEFVSEGSRLHLTTHLSRDNPFAPQAVFGMNQSNQSNYSTRMLSRGLSYSDISVVNQIDTSLRISRRDFYNNDFNFNGLRSFNQGGVRRSSYYDFSRSIDPHTYQLGGSGVEFNLTQRNQHDFGISNLTSNDWFRLPGANTFRPHYTFKNIFDVNASEMRFGGTYLETATWGSNGLTPSQIRNRENWPIIAAWYDAHHESYQRFDNAFQRANQVCPLFPENQRQFAKTVIVLATLGPARKVTEIGIGYLGSQAGNAFRGLNWLYNRGKTLYDVKQAADVNLELSNNNSLTNPQIVPYHTLAKRQFGQAAWQAFSSRPQGHIRISGGRTVKEEMARQKLSSGLYDEIRNSTHDIQKISNNLNMPEFHVRRIKEHLFYNKHQLDHGLGIDRFHPDFEIATAWKRLEAGTHLESDLQLLRHEHFESRYEGIFRTDYKTAHDAANRAGYRSGLEEQLNIGARNGFVYRDQ